jgi:hypothetical protein
MNRRAESGPGDCFSRAFSNNHLTIKRAIERGVRGNKPFLETEPLYLGSGVAKRQPGKGVGADAAGRDVVAVNVRHVGELDAQWRDRASKHNGTCPC